MEGRKTMGINWKMSARYQWWGNEAISQMVAVSAWRNTDLAKIPVRGTGCARTDVLYRLSLPKPNVPGVKKSQCLSPAHKIQPRRSIG